MNTPNRGDPPGPPSRKDLLELIRQGRVRADPALLSGPTLFTVADTCGFVLVLSLAAAMLPRLSGG